MDSRTEPLTGHFPPILSSMVAEAAARLATLARDPAERVLMASGHAIPAAVVALRCMVPPLAAAWRHADAEGIANAIGTAGGSRTQAKDSPIPDVGDCKGWSEVELAGGCTSVCRLLRNLCAACPEGQARVKREGGLGLLIMLVHICCTWHERPTGGSDTALSNTLLSAALQAVSNSAVGCEENKEAAWEGLWPVAMVRIFDSPCADSCKEVAAMVLHTLMLGCPERVRDFAEKEACGAILGGLLRATYAPQHPPMSEEASLMREKMGFWTECVAGQVLRGGYLMKVHQRLSTDPGQRVRGQDPMELLFWYLVEDMVTPRVDDGSKEDERLRLSPVDCGYVAHEFAFVLKMCAEGASRGDKGSSNLAACLKQLLQVVAASISCEDKAGRAAMRERGLLRNVVELLKAAIAREQGGEGGTATAGSDEAMSEIAHPDSGLKRVLVRVLGNMAYKDRDSQDAIRSLGAIPLILASTALDEKHPFAREWGLFAVRNLCEDNLENQQAIGDLKPSKVMSLPPELNQKGVSVTLDQQTGKLKFSNDTDAGGRVGPAQWRQVSKEEERRRGVEDTQRMVDELKDMGLEATLDEDTGLVDISRKGVPKPVFKYPGGGGGGAGEGRS